MHRPAAKDVDLVFARALHEAPELVGPAERLKRALAAEDYESAKLRLAEFHERALELDVPSVEKQVARSRGRAARPQAYWRAPTWKRVTAIVAGPLTNLLFAVVLFAIVFMVGGRERRPTTVVPVLNGKPAPRPPASSPGDRGRRAINGRPVTADSDSRTRSRARTAARWRCTVLSKRGT